MSDIIRNWLMYVMGVVIKQDDWYQDDGGLLIARILNHYSLISEYQVMDIEQKGERTTSALEYMRNVILSLGIDLPPENFREVLLGHSTRCIALLYELYRVLHDKTNMDTFATRIRAKVHDENSRFIVFNKNEIQGLKLKHGSKFDNPLARPLHEWKDVVEWYRNKYQWLVDKCKASRNVYLEYAKNLRLLESEKMCKSIVDGPADVIRETLCVDDRTIDLTYEELFEEGKKARELGCVVPDEKVSRKIVMELKRKRRKEHARAEMKEYFERMMYSELWGKVLGDQEKYFKEDFNAKLLKQSLFEQQMTTKLFEIRQQEDAILESRYKLMEFARAEEEQQFVAHFLKEERKDLADKLHYYAERRRNLELHQRLYAEKRRRKAEKRYNACVDVVNDIIDMAIYTADFERTYNEKLPRRKRNDLASLFVKEQPMFDILEDAVDVLDYNPGEMDENLEELYTNELDRQNCMDEFSFEAYCLYQWPWTKMPMNEEVMVAGMNVVGFVVHRLLLAKYPKRAPLPPPAVPKVSVSACINGLHSLEYIPALTRLLSARKIRVIQLQECINYCLGVWKDESTVEYMDEVLVKDTEAAAEVIKPKGKKVKESKGKKQGKKDGASKKKSQASSVPAVVQKTFESKTVQTPKLFPCEELVLSPAGDLGRIAFEVLNLGESPNDHLVVSMFVEYLKTLKDIDGWVLVNYPQTMAQAAMLEEALTTVRVPYVSDAINDVDSIYDIVDIKDREIPQNEYVDDEYSLKRLSKLVPNPKPIDVPLYDTYLTAYIDIRSIESDDFDEQYFGCFKDFEDDNLLNRFYMDQGCKYTLYYKKIDFPTVKHLGKLILGEYSVPPKASLELFTDAVNYVEAEWDELTKMTSQADKVGEKKVKPEKKQKKDKGEKGNDKKDEKKSKSGKGKSEKGKSEKSKSGKGKGDKKGKKGAAEVVIVHEDKATQEPEPPEIIAEPEEEPEPDPLPGEDSWIYTTLPIPQQLMEALASLWENMESTYTCDFKQLFFRKRILLDALIPYNTYVRNNMRDFIARPDDKQHHLREFQACYNDLDEDMREDDEVKAELHARLHEFREKLWKICDARMRESDEERRQIISNNWTANLLYELVNIFVTFMQLETDRCSDTIQMLVDYYTAVVTGLPCESQPLEKSVVETIVVPIDSNVDEYIKEYVDFVTTLLTETIEPDYSVSPYHKIVKKNTHVCSVKVENYKNAAEKNYQKLECAFAPKGKGKGGKKPKEDKSKSSKTGQIVPKILEPSVEVKDRALELLAEFKAAYEGETSRVHQRLELIERVARENIENTLRSSMDNFRLLHDEIKGRYDRETESVRRVCDVFSEAIEAETKIQPELILAADEFLIKFDSVLFESELPKVALPVVEREDDEHFTIAQLHVVTDIFAALAPNGLIPERALTFLLQDFLVQNAEDGKSPMVPKLWAKLDPFKTHYLSQELFGNSEFVDWKDFVLYNLGVSFPTESELLETRRQFRELDPDATEVIYDHQFGTIQFWFESEAGDDVSRLRFRSIRELLSKLYKIDAHRLNYTSLLLSFCKDANPVCGLAKALALSTGVRVNWKKESGRAKREAALEQLREEHNEVLRQRIDHIDTELMADEIVVDLIDTSVHRADSAYLEDVTDITEEVLMDTIDEHFADPEERDLPVSVQYDRDELFKYLETTLDVVEMEEHSSSSFLFTNPSQGFDTVEAPVMHTLDRDVLINVLTVALPWHARIRSVGDSAFRERVGLIYEALYEPDLGALFAYRLMNHPTFVDLLERVYKFHVRDPTAVVKKLLGI